jgi:hypothetical protein
VSWGHFFGQVKRSGSSLLRGKEPEIKVPTYFVSNDTVVQKNFKKAGSRVFVGTPTTGLVRIEWHNARIAQTIPCNWSFSGGTFNIPAHAPLGYGVADAQNLIAKFFLSTECEWLLFIEEDNVLPPDCFLRLNEYIRTCEYPVVSALYFTKSFPAEPLIYRGVGNSFYSDWQLDDLVMCDGTGTGCVLIHRSIIQAAWDISPEININGTLARQIFKYPEGVYFDPEKGTFTGNTGTTDIKFYHWLKEEELFEKAGWRKFQRMAFPILVDTRIVCGHIDQSGRIYPSMEEIERWRNNKRRSAFSMIAPLTAWQRFKSWLRP